MTNAPGQDFHFLHRMDDFRSVNFGFKRVFLDDWISRPEQSKAVGIISLDESIVDRLRTAVRMLARSIETDPEIRSGVPVLKGTRFPVSRILAEMADEQTVSAIADDFDLDADLIKEVVKGLSICLDRPFASIRAINYEL